MILARAGQDLEEYRLRYSHLGIAYRDGAALGGRGVWRVVHKLNECGSDRGDLYRQGLAEFFSDGLFRYQAGVVVLAPEVQSAMHTALGDNTRLARLHQPRYNMLAYPGAPSTSRATSGPSRPWRCCSSPAWLIASVPRPGSGCAPTVRPRCTFRPSSGSGAHRHRPIAFDDQPFERRMSGRIDTVTVDSVFEWLSRSGLGSTVQVIDATPPQRPPAATASATAAAGASGDARRAARPGRWRSLAPPCLLFPTRCFANLPCESREPRLKWNLRSTQRSMDDTFRIGSACRPAFDCQC